MKRSVLLLLACAAVAAHSAYPGFGLFGGASFPAGPTGSAAGFNLGSGALLGGCFRVATGDIGDIEIAASYHPRHRPRDFTPSATTRESKFTVTPVTVGANGTYQLEGHFGFRAGVGAGFYILKWFEEGTAAGENGDFKRILEIDRAGFFGTLGPVLQFEGFAFELLGRFHYIIDEDEYNYRYDVGGPGLPATFIKGYNDMFVDVTVGVTYYFI